METFENRTAVITGAASGIGRGTALALAKRGAHITVVDRDEKSGAEAAEEIKSLGVDSLFVEFDVASTSFEPLREAVLKHFGKIDILMNNAAVVTRGLFEHLPDEEWLRLINIDLMSVVRGTRAFLPDMIAQGAGHIVNTSSFNGLYTYSFDRLPYGAVKAGIVQLSEGLAIYLRPKGIHVTLLCPGPVATNIAKSFRFFGPPTEMRGPGAEFEFMDANVVGEMVADAIRAKKFFLPTHPEVTHLLVQRAQTWDAFLEHQIEHPHVLTIPGERVQGGQE